MISSAQRALALVGIPLILAACSDAPEQAAPEAVRPVKTMVIPDPESGNIRTFPARIESQRRAEVSFRIPGTIVELPVKEGQPVKKGDVIAKLDPKDFELIVDEREAILFRAQRDYERAVPLAAQDYITQRELDRREADYKSAEASLQLAKQDLVYTTLTAPFEGDIAKRLVQNFQEVQEKQPIVELRDLSALEVKVDVPEQIIIRLNNVAEERGEVRVYPDIFVSFNNAPGRQFDLTFKEVAARADPATRTFEATYTMTTPDDLTVLPGMTANVTADLGAFLGTGDIVYVPSEAVTATNDLGGKVFIVNEDSMSLETREVALGPLRGSEIAITDGLTPGERIVIAGVPFLYEGMKVTVASTLEQAVEREEDTVIRRRAEERLMKADETDSATAEQSGETQ